MMRDSMDRSDGRAPARARDELPLVYGSVLAASGRWDEAEAVMTTALGPTSSKSLGHRIETTCNLLVSRHYRVASRRPPRFSLPTRIKSSPVSLPARPSLRKGDAALAAAIARRGLRPCG